MVNGGESTDLQMLNISTSKSSQRGLTELDIMKVAEKCHNEISNRTSYVEVLRKEVITFLQNIMMICIVNASLDVRSKKQVGMIN